MKQNQIKNKIQEIGNRGLNFALRISKLLKGENYQITTPELTSNFLPQKQEVTTEFDFILPKGLIDAKGTIHRQGKMRLATAKDEMFVQQHPQVQENPAYSVLVYLSQVITRLGSLSSVTPQFLEDLTVIDLAYLREFYNRINQHKTATIPVQCPHCDRAFKVELALSGES